MKKLLLLVVALFTVFAITACIDPYDAPEVVGMNFTDDLNNIVELSLPTDTLFMTVSAEEDSYYDAPSNSEQWLVVQFRNNGYEIDHLYVNEQQWEVGMCEQNLSNLGYVCQDGDRLVSRDRDRDRTFIYIPINTGNETDTTIEYQINRFGWTNDEDVPKETECEQTRTETHTRAMLYTHKAMPQTDPEGPQYNAETGELIIKLQNQDQSQIQIRLFGEDPVVLVPDVDDNDDPIIDEDGYYTYRYTVQTRDNGNGNQTIQFKLQFYNGARQQDCLDEVEMPEAEVPEEE